MNHPGAVARAAELAALGHAAAPDPAARDRLRRAVHDDIDPRVRTAALGALVRLDATDARVTLVHALGDPAPAVRRRAAELAPAVAPDTPDGSDALDDQVAPALVDALHDPDVTVVESVTWALGELGDRACAAGAVAALAEVTRTHGDALAREAAVAALGALGDPAALPVVLDACRDKPAVRRRAVLALAPFDGPEVDAAIDAALADRDWQVRQAAEDLRT